MMGAPMDNSLLMDFLGKSLYQGQDRTGILGQAQQNIRNQAVESGNGYWQQDTMMMPVMGDIMSQINPAYTQGQRYSGDPMEALAQYRQSGQMPGIGGAPSYTPFTPPETKYESVPIGDKTFVATDTKGPK